MMTLSLRQRILLTLLPLLALLAILGVAAIVVIHRLGGRIDAIMRENYDSVVYMERLKEALERIDSSFAFALFEQEEVGRKQYREQWERFNANLLAEQNNITLKDEGPLVAHLTHLSEQYRKQGDAFFARPPRDPQRRKDYLDQGGLQDTFRELKDTADRILNLNQNHMKNASREAKATAEESLVGFMIALAVVA